VLGPICEAKYLALFKSATSVHADPFHCSVIARSGGLNPPETKNAGEVPDPKGNLLAVFKSVVSVQLEPFQASWFVLFCPGGA